MKTVKLEEFVEINPEVRLNKGKEYPCVMMEDITPGCRYISSEGRRAYKGGSRFRKGDVLFARITPCLENGKIAQYVGREDGFGSTEFFVFRHREGVSDQGYIFYLVLTDIIRKPAEKSFYGVSGRQRADLNVVRKIEVPAPPLPIQRKIAEVLSAYDDLIEVNTRRIRILEQMMQAVYREWFGKVDAQSLPEGWKLMKLGDAIELPYGKGLKADIRIEGKVPVFGSGGLVGYHNQSLVKGPGIIVGRKGNVGSVFWSDDDFYPIDTVFYVQTQVSLYYIFCNLQTQNFINNDAAVPGLNRNQAYSLSFILPPKNILDKFDQFVAPIFQQTRTLHNQNANLQRTRDLLLPRLISGELDLEGLEVAGDK